MTIKFHSPQFPLRRFVKSMFWYEGYSGNSKYEIIIPDATPLLAIELDGNERFFSKNINCKTNFTTINKSWIKGLCSQPFIFQSEQNASTFCIQFEPSGLNKFLGIPANELTNNIISAELLLGTQINELRERLIEKQSFEERIKIIENFLFFKLGSSLNEKCIIDHLSSHANLSELSLEEISKHLNFSKKHTIALYRKEFGLTPKKLQILLNVNKSLEIFNKPNLFPTAQTAIECNHFDQSHFIKNFKFITSITPHEYLKLYKIYPHVLAIN